MRTIGLLGGLTWHSTAGYYERINRGVAGRLGPFRSAKIVMHSVDYGEVRRSRDDGNWRRLGKQLVRACRGLEQAGADGVFLCSNTIHEYAPRIQSQISIPIVHIADAVAERAHADGLTGLALFGTAFTMSRPFIRQRLEAAGLRVFLPDEGARASIDRIILEELAAGDVCASSRAVFTEQMALLQRQGAEAMVLGCTEIGLLIDAEHVEVPVLDTTPIHADRAVAWALE